MGKVNFPEAIDEVFSCLEKKRLSNVVLYLRHLDADIEEREVRGLVVDYERQRRTAIHWILREVCAARGVRYEPLE